MPVKVGFLPPELRQFLEKETVCSLGVTMQGGVYEVSLLDFVDTDKNTETALTGVWTWFKVGRVSSAMQTEL